MPDTAAYYESDYRILLSQDDEDQIYEVYDDRIIYRTDHQVATLLNKLDFPPGTRLLDYGCAKASTPKRLLDFRSDLEMHLFDVSTMYEDHWLRFLEPQRYAIHHTPAFWHGYFDVVTSFFALEHISEPIKTVQNIAKLLKDDGIFYGIVPDTFGNVADFVVIDHVNHFTAASLYTLLRTADFRDIQIDVEAHRGALVFTARKTGMASTCPDVKATLARSVQLADYWTNLNDNIQNVEHTHLNEPAAIYGSGFYGAYIASVLLIPERIICFLDASPYQQEKHLFGKPIIAPTRLPDSVRVLYIGLNPRIARNVIAQLDWLSKRDINVIYLGNIPDD